MSKVIITTIIAITTLVTFTSADAAVSFVVNEPTAGNVGFFQNFSINGQSTPDGAFGRSTNGSLGTVAGGVGSMIGTGSFWDIAGTTSANTTASAQYSGANDWIYVMSVRIDTFQANTRIVELGGPTGDLFFLDMQGTNGIRLQGDNTSSGGYGSLVSVETGSNVFTELAVIYDASENNFNWYQDGTQIAADADPRSDGGGPHAWGQTTRNGGNAFSGAWSYDYILSSENFEIIIIPEPGTLSLMAMGAGLLIVHRRRMRA